MFQNVGGLDVYYERYSGEGTPVLLLHGWGCDSAVMKGLFNYIKSLGRSVISVDFPYFGKSAAPPDTFTVFDYAEVIDKLLGFLNIEKAIILGHSFGGRIAVILSQKYDKAEKLIFIDAAGIKPKKSIKKRLKIIVYKIKKRLKLNTQNAGSADYQALPDGMKKVFVHVVNTHLEKEMKQIQAPALLIWGKNDADTPLYMAKKMNKLIKGSGLVILENAGHYSFADRYNDTCLIIKAFIL